MHQEEEEEENTRQTQNQRQREREKNKKRLSFGDPNWQSTHSYFRYVVSRVMQYFYFLDFEKGSGLIGMGHSFFTSVSSL